MKPESIVPLARLLLETNKSSSLSLADGTLLELKILDALSGNRYRIHFGGKVMVVKSKNHLFPNEILKTRVFVQQGKTEFSILQRELDFSTSFMANKKENLGVENIAEFIQKFKSNKEETNFESLWRAMQSYFPEMDLDPNTWVYHWQWEDGEAEVVTGFKKEANTITIRFEMKHTGKSVFYLQWNKKEPESITIQAFFTKQSSYEYSIRNKNIFDQFMSKFKIKPTGLLFKYIGKSKEQRKEWKI